MCDVYVRTLNVCMQAEDGGPDAATDAPAATQAPKKRGGKQAAAKVTKAAGTEVCNA